MQIKIVRSMSVEHRLELAFEMSMTCRELMRAGVRHQHRDWSEAQVAHEVHRFAFFPQPLPDWVQ
jgi:hypothetical protein